MNKKWYASKTIWFNVLAIVVMIASAFGYTGEISQDWSQYMVWVSAAINILLRFKTKQPVGK